MKISKTRKTIGWVLSLLPVVALILASLGKFTQQPKVVENLGNLNIDPLMLGIVIIVCVILYLVPKTSNIGFFLLCSYFGGVIVARLANGDNVMIAIGLTILLYVGTMLRKPALSGLGI